MDVNIAWWIIEFLLRQNSLDDRLLDVTIRGLPLPTNNQKLQKILLLRQIDSDLKKGTISERTLEILEQIEELDHRGGNAEVSEAMKAAYCTVAVHCTAKFIGNSPDDKSLYFNALKRIWRGRVCVMERFDAEKRVGLVSDDLLSWMDDIERGVWDESVYENVLARYKELDVLEVVRRYVNEAKEKMGPSFLESVAERASSDEALRRIMCLGEDRIKEGESSVVQNAREDVDANETCTETTLPRRKHIANVISKEVGGGSRKRPIVVDAGESSLHEYDKIPTPQVDKVQLALETSTLDLHKMVEDPLPETLLLAESLKACIDGENMAHKNVVNDSSKVNVDAPSSSHDRNDEALQGNGGDVNNEFCGDKNNVRKPSLMQRNSTAHTVEWSDSIDDSDEPPIRPHLKSPQKRPVSPLKKYDMKKLTMPRKRRRWTTIEEDTLRTGVQKYGKGNWKMILISYKDLFEDRTEVDLKDKWRNLMRYN